MADYMVQSVSFGNTTETFYRQAPKHNHAGGPVFTRAAKSAFVATYNANNPNNPITVNDAREGQYRSGQPEPANGTEI